MPTITKLKTSTAKEKEELILELLDGEALPKCIERLNDMIDTAHSYIESTYSSQDTRFHWIEIQLICEDLLEHFYGLLGEAFVRHAERN